MKQINVNDLNGTETGHLSVITRVIQEADPIKFSELCNNLLNEFIGREEAIINYAIQTNIINTNTGAVLVLTAVLQQYATKQEKEEYIQEIKRANLLIK